MSAEITDALSAFCSTRLSDVGGKNSSDWVLLSQKPSSRGKSDFNQIQRWTECSLLLREKMISHVPLPSENSKIYPLQPLPKPFSLLADDFFSTHPSSVREQTQSEENFPVFWPGLRGQEMRGVRKHQTLPEAEQNGAGSSGSQSDEMCKASREEGSTEKDVLGACPPGDRGRKTFIEPVMMLPERKENDRCNASYCLSLWQGKNGWYICVGWGPMQVLPGPLWAFVETFCPKWSVGKFWVVGFVV